MKFTWQKTDHGSLDNLGQQMQKIVRNMNENRMETRWRYIEAEKRFIHYVSKEFHVKKLSNIQDKHLKAYADYKKAAGCSDKYIKTDLAAIRFFHNHTPDTKYELTDSRKFNQKSGLAATPDGRADRAWSEREIDDMKNRAIDLGRPEVARVIEVIKATGMRLDEACTLKRSDIERALKTGKLHLENTKGGVPRDVPLTDRASNFLQMQLDRVRSEGYVFTPKAYVEAHKIHSFERSIQDFIYNHRDAIQDPDRSATGHNLRTSEKGALTIHGLRHSYGRAAYLQLREQGIEREQARLEVSRMLGHGRDSVTYIYLGGSDA